MIIHSVTPLQMLAESQEQPKLRELEIEGGILEGFDSPSGFVAQRLLSTDPSLYLKKEYAPGSILPGALSPNQAGTLSAGSRKGD